MGIPSELRDMWVNRKDALVIPSPAEEAKLLRSKKCIDEGVQEGFKYSAVVAVISSVATLGAVRTVPWAKYNLNYTSQALIISAGMTYLFIFCMAYRDSSFAAIYLPDRAFKY